MAMTAETILNERHREMITMRETALRAQETLQASRDHVAKSHAEVDNIMIRLQQLETEKLIAVGRLLT